MAKHTTTQLPKTAFQFLAPGSISGQGPGTGASERALTGIAYSGEIVTDHGYWSRLVIDLASLSVDAPIPLLSCHNQDETVGMVTLATTQAGNLAIEARLFADVDDEAAAIAAKADKGFPWQLSVGIRPTSIEEIQTGVTLSINNRNFQGPLTVFRGGRVREISICAIGADSRTSATVLNAGDFIEIPLITHEVDAMTLEEAQAKITELEAELAQLKAQNTELSAATADPAQFVPIELFTAAQSENAQLHAQLNANTIKHLIEPALADGRLLPGQKDWAEALGKSDFAALSTYLETAQPIAALSGTQTQDKAPDQRSKASFKAAQGYEVDADQAELHAKAIDYQTTHKVDFTTAVLAVGG